MKCAHLVVKESTWSIRNNKKHMRVKNCFKTELNSGILGKDLLSVSNGKLNWIIKIRIQFCNIIIRIQLVYIEFQN